MLLPQMQRRRRCSATQLQNAQPRTLPESCLARFPMHFPCGEATRPGLRKRAERACGTVVCTQFSSTGFLSMRGLADSVTAAIGVGRTGVQVINFGQGRRTLCQILLDLLHGLRPDVRSQVHTGRQQGENQSLPVHELLACVGVTSSTNQIQDSFKTRSRCVFSRRCLGCSRWSLLLELGSAGWAVARIS